MSVSPTSPTSDLTAVEERARGTIEVDAQEILAALGIRIRLLRRHQRLTLASVARATGLSTSMVSAVERGKASPSIGSLVAIASALGVQMNDLFATNGDSVQDPVRRRGAQPTFVTAQGVLRRLVASDSRRGVEVAVNEYEPGTASAPSPMHHEGQEYGLVVRGQLVVELDGRSHHLGEGDGIAYESSVPHRISNPGRRHAVAVWVNLGRGPVTATTRRRPESVRTGRR